MSPDNFQRFIGQHPTLFAIIFPAYFITLWFLVGTIISFVGGWLSLSRTYRTREPFNGAKWRGQSVTHADTNPLRPAEQRYVQEHGSQAYQQLLRRLFDELFPPD